MSNEQIVSVTFKLKDGKTRVFSPADHGDEFMKLADEFKDTNADKIEEVVNDDGSTVEAEATVAGASEGEVVVNPSEATAPEATAPEATAPEATA